MWKDFFYYSKPERRVILLLCSILLGMAGVYVYLSYCNSTSEEIIVEESDEIASFMAHLKEKEKTRKAYSYASRQKAPEVVILKPFDPNTADSATFRQLGLPAFMAQNVLKYRAKGGVFRTPASFSKIYGMTEEQFSTLLPYIEIGTQFLKKDTFRRPTLIPKDTLPTVVKYPEGTIIDLNACDTAELKLIPGIGSGLASMIVAYRHRLGGYYAVEQLQEIPYLDATLNKWFTVNSSKELRRLSVNKDGLERLRNHPYMNFYKAKVILEHRRRRGKIKNLSQLSMYKEFAEKDLNRLAPYLSFDD